MLLSLKWVVTVLISLDFWGFLVFMPLSVGSLLALWLGLQGCLCFDCIVCYWNALRSFGGFFGLFTFVVFCGW